MLKNTRATFVDPTGKNLSGIRWLLGVMALFVRRCGLG